MPSWNIHLEAGERLADNLKFSGRKRRMFLLGCLLPDINNGYINHVRIEKDHGETHFHYDDKSSLNFYSKYKKEIEAREPIYMGYLFHLYTDGFFNYNFYCAIKNTSIGDGLTREEKLRIKHHDYWIYDSNFQHQLGINNEEELNKMAIMASKISTVDISPREIMEVEEILQSEDLNAAVRGDKYTFYSKEELDKIMTEMIESFTNDYLRRENA